MEQALTDKTNQLATRVFEKRSFIPVSVQDLKKWHEQPGALQKLTPFPIIIQVIRDDRVAVDSGELEFRLWFGPLPLRWVVNQEPGPLPNASFADRMLEGPMAVWHHEHIFWETENGVELIDRITLAHKAGWRGLLTRLMFDGLPLRMLFFFRHWRTRREVMKGQR